MASAPSSFEQIYHATRNMDFNQAKVYFENAKRNTPALREKTHEEFAKYWLQKDANDHYQGKYSLFINPFATAKQLWDAVCFWEPHPLHPSPRSSVRPIHELIYSDTFGPVPLGKLRGEIMCALVPTTNTITPTRRYRPESLRYSKSDDFAISYADGHPSEDQILLTVQPDQDTVLRRFVALGYVMMKIRGEWVKTGHVLVLDADYGRKCHPWIVLAHEWELHDWEEWDIDYDKRLVHAEKKVMKGDSKAHGVLPFPDHHNRTPIARLTHYGKGVVEQKQKFVMNFGPDFNFDINRMGKDRSSKRSKYGPDLAEFMSWYWDPVKEEEVCYTDDGNEYYRFNAVKGYSGPHLVPKNQVGNIVEDGSLESRMEQVNIGPPGPASGPAPGPASSRAPGHTHGRAQRSSTVY